HEEWLARPDMWQSRLHPDDCARVRREAREAQESATPMDSQYRLLAKDGTVRWFHDRGEFLPDRDGMRCVWQGIMLDVTAQREAEEALRESEARARTLLETAYEGVWVVNAVGVTTYVNARMCEMLARSADEVLGQSLFDFMPPSQAFEARTLFARRQRGISEVHEFTLRRRDGSELHVLISTSPLFAPDGEFAGALGMATDVSLRRAAQQALQESEARYRHVVANAPGMVYQFVYRPDGTKGYTFVSEGVRKLFGIDPEAVVHDSDVLLSIVHPDERDELRRKARAVALEGGEFRWEGRVILGSGEERFIEVVALDQRTADGSVLSDGLVVDVTERRRAAQRLEESELRFRLASRATKDVLFDWDVATGRVMWGEALQSAFHYGADAVETSYDWWLQRVNPVDASRMTASIAAVLGGAAEAWSEEYRFRRGDGTYAEVLARGYVLRDAAGRALRMVGSMIDLSEHRQLEEQFRQAQKMEAVGRLAGGIAHDFNNLLTVIKASTGFLLEDLDRADPRREDARHVAEAAERAVGLTRQLLAFSRKQMLEPQVLDVNTVVENLRPMLVRLIGEDVTVEARLAERAGSVMADVGQLEQVLINLAVNARDAMPDGGRLVIETAEVTLDERYAQGYARHEQCAVLPGHYVMLAVSDTGTGMSPEVKARIFEPFYTTKESGKGTGLGLSTVYGIMKQSGGHVWVYSEPGEGTVFKLYFPRLEEAATVSLKRTGEFVAGGTETVLLVEDEASVRQLARRLLERQGYRVLECCNGRDALAQATAYGDHIHLILTDVVMPELSGRGLVERLRAVRPTAAVIYMSGYTDDEVLRRGMLEPGSLFVQKPFTPEGLLRTVREALNRGAGSGAR
ncbi:MAG TPA: PAS domain-containing protein, partial [Gemmatimonadaceae bacterium]|nr:PAS domain-containing protein [Gemmatimonadaceae bacterium]